MRRLANALTKSILFEKIKLINSIRYSWKQMESTKSTYIATKIYKPICNNSYT
ncbi:hypothetical protein P3J6_110428 [Pseudoalteromonas sp. 3J6]|nr:hypothetical protein P3J6_110428 [Pseudoalteromonas sp. 3J6]